MSNNFITQGVEVVQKAIEADNGQDYEQALVLYKRALEFFITGLKYEQNPSVKESIKERVGGYMKRAEQIKSALDDSSKGNNKGGGGSGVGTKSKNDKNKEDDEAAKSKLY